MRKISIVLLLFLIMVALSSCAAIDTVEEKMSAAWEIVDPYIKTMIFQNSTIKETEEYQTYQRLLDEKAINENNEYKVVDEIRKEEDEYDTTTSLTGDVKLSFANNNFIDVSYFTNEEKTERLLNPCYVNYGDKIYVKYAVNNENSTSFVLDHFRVIYNSEDPNDNVKLTPDSNGFLIEIPQDTTIKSVSLYPIGQYVSRNILLEVINDENGAELFSAGKWSVNSSEYDASKPLVVDAKESYSIRFDYDKDTWFFVDSSPEAFASDANQVGYVEFGRITPKDNVGFDVLSVKLHRYLALSIDVPKSASVEVNGNKVETKKKNGNTYICDINSLCFGDNIKITTSGTVTITDGDYEHLSVNRDSLGNGNTVYILTVNRQKNGNAAAELIKNGINVLRNIEVTLLASGKYGYCTYKLGKETLSGKEVIKEGSVIVMEYNITKQGYCFEPVMWQKKPKTKKLEMKIAISMDGKTIDPDDYFKVIEEKQ